jgi:hypothetical protein
MRKLIRNLEDAESREFWNNLERCVAVAVKKWPAWLHDAFESAGDSPVGGSLVGQSGIGQAAGRAGMVGEPGGCGRESGGCGG